ncbi:hypothetical protein C7999DRAFT_35862 [Corynascus novoguineensis]|uniref:C2H2-type domain-containing protein n=1 Tax=Corynascus novoguineensis TaxID=1126955 RepID=A0AAN7CL55_9PEZI|nr:hypothetical protein C7999DRAFT_35862 [Corynascus novoguineensis]
MATHLRPNAFHKTLHNAPDSFLTTTVPNSSLCSGDDFRDTEPSYLSHLVDHWKPDARALSYYAGLQPGPSGNSDSSHCSQLTQELAGWRTVSSLYSAHTSAMKQEGNLGHVSQSFPSSTLADRSALTLNNRTEEPTGTNERTSMSQSPRKHSVEPRYFSKQRHSRVIRSRKQSWPLPASNETGLQSFNCDISGCHMTFNNSRGLGAHLEMHEQSHQVQTAAHFASPASVFSKNSTDSGYMSSFDLTPLPWSPINTPDLDASTSPSLSEDVMLKICDMQPTKNYLECDEVTTSRDAYLVNGFDLEIGTAEGCAPSTMASVPFHRQLSRWGEIDESLATDDEDMDSDGQSRAPTPWPESWYEGGSELGLQRFAAKFIADVEAANDEFDTTQCPADNDARQHGHEDMGATTAGTSSTTGQTTYAGHQSSGGHSTKRPRSSDDGGEDEDRSPKKRDTKRPPDSNPNPRKFYACPYQKRKPEQSPFCGMPHGSKRDFGWDNVSRVKQHLLESHGLDHHCRKCWRAYKKVQDARNCHETKNCFQRISPPKHWLSETQIAQLKAERVSSQSDDAWYRIADLLFDSEQDYNPESFRNQHTPYYERVNLRNPISGDPSPYRSPDSTWTPASDSTNPPGSTPMPGNQNVTPPTEPAKEGESAPATNPFPQQQAQGFHDQPRPETASTVAREAFEPVVGPEPYQCDNPEAAVAIPTIASAHGYTAPETTSYFLLPEQLLQASTVQNLDADGLGQFSHFGSTAADPSQPHPAFLGPATPAAAARRGLHQFTDPVVVQQSSLGCSCGHTQKCICRLKKRVTKLRSENESLWAEKEMVRKALVGLRQTLERQAETLQFMEEKSLRPDEAMGKLWKYHDKMRALVLEHC